MKRIIIGTHEYSGIYKNIVNDLEKSGHQVFSIIFTHYPKSRQGFFKKVFKGKQNKSKFILRDSNQAELIKILNQYPENYFDYSFFIRADFYTKKILSKVTSLSKFNFSYHWDGLDRFPGILSRINYFDKFYVYEKNDYSKYKNQFSNLYITDSFYFNYEIKNSVKTQNNPDILFIGACKQSRMNDIVSYYNKFKQLNLKTEIRLYYEDLNLKKQFENNDFIFFNSPLDYHETLSITKSSKVILDILIKENFSHSGLSLRFFESIKLEKKIITDNQSVLAYDFYNPQNIFIIGIDDEKKLNSFVNSSYQTIPSEIKSKYNFINWFNEKTNSLNK